MDYAVAELEDARRQIASVLHKLQASLDSMQNRADAGKLKSQITLAQRRIKAFKLANALIEKAMSCP